MQPPLWRIFGNYSSKVETKLVEPTHMTNQARKSAECSVIGSQAPLGAAYDNVVFCRRRVHSPWAEDHEGNFRVLAIEASSEGLELITVSHL